MNKNDCIIRLEKKEEYRKVENLVRESFWNVYRTEIKFCLKGVTTHEDS